METFVLNTHNSDHLVLIFTVSIFKFYALLISNISNFSVLSFVELKIP